MFAFLRQVIEATDVVDLTKGYDIFVKTLNDSSVDFAVRVWTENVNYWPAYFSVTENVKKSFDQAGVGISLPQMELHIKQPAART
ncbi:MAG: small conductance mechanosensitive channel [Neolewinella sp.]